MKKFIIYVLLFASLLSFALFSVACDKNEKVEVGNTLFYALEDSTVDRYSQIEFKLLETITGKCKWTSSDESVIAVKDGIAVAYKEGEATITAELGDKTQTQRIVVVENPTALMLLVNDLPVLIDSSYEISPALLFKGELVDAQFDFSSDNDSVATVEGNVLHGRKLGVANITVTAKWRGNDNVISKTVACKVNADFGIKTDEHAYEVYVRGNVRGVNYATTHQIEAEVYAESNVIEGAEVTWSIENQSIATITEDGLISAVKEGQTFAVGEYNDSTLGLIQTVKIPVKVTVPILQTDDDVIIDLNKTKSAIDEQTVLGRGSAVGKVINAKTLTQVPIERGEIVTETLKAGEYRYVIYDDSGEFGVEVNAYVSDYVVYGNQDFLDIYKHHDAKYIVLAVDVLGVGDYKNLRRDDVFSGVFNGLGHTVSGFALITHGCGMFSHAQGATFKNFRFADASFKYDSTIVDDAGNKIGTGGNRGLLFYRSTGEINIDNVHIELTEFNRGAYMCGTLFGLCFSGKINITNSIIISLKVGTSSAACAAIGGAVAGKVLFNNTFVVTDGTICGTATHPFNRKFTELNNLSISYESIEQLESDVDSGLVKLNKDGFNRYWSKQGILPTFGG